MKHMSTWDLLDLADDYKQFSNYPSEGFEEGATEMLTAIDTELLSRMPEGEFVTMLDDSGNPVGFEPAYYVGLAEAQAELQMIDESNDYLLSDSSYYFYRD